MPKITAVIPVFGRADVLRTVPRLLSYYSDAAFRIVVVDNGNARELSFRLAELVGDRVRVVRLEENGGGSGGFIAGVNAALSAGDPPEGIWLLDDDATPDANTLPGLLNGLAFLKASGIERIACIGSARLNEDAPFEIMECGADFSLWRWKMFFHLANQRLTDVCRDPIPVDYCAGYSVLIPTDVIRRVGFWEDVFIHYDDVEWGLRAKRRFGLQSYATVASTVRHPRLSLTQYDAWRFYFDVRNQFWLCARYNAVALVRHLLLSAVKVAYLKLSERNSERLFIRMTAMRDFFAGRRRTRREIVAALERHASGHRVQC